VSRTCGVSANPAEAYRSGSADPQDRADGVGARISPLRTSLVVVTQQHPGNAILAFLGLVLAFVATVAALRGYRRQSRAEDNAIPDGRAHPRPIRGAIVAVIGLAIAVLAYFLPRPW
jgi:hypothetical protein